MSAFVFATCGMGMVLAQVPAAPTLLTPADEASRVVSADFSWSPTSGATSYHIQISTAYSFAAPLLNDSGFTTVSRSIGPFDTRTVFFWRVRAKNADGAGPWSAIRTFTSFVPLPQPDSAGWIRLFRGDNVSDFFVANNGSTPPGRLLGAFPNSTYQITGDTIRVTGSPAGQLYFKQPFSHYKVRYQMRFPGFTGTGNGGTGNCGMLLHVQAHDTPTNGFPRSVESQGDPTQGMGQLWPIGDVWVTVRARTVSSRMQYDSTVAEIDYGGANWNARVVVGVNGWGFPTFASQQQDGWVTQEAHVYGSDSIIHFAGGQMRIKYRNPRVSSGGTVNNVSKFLSRGLLAWQSEGTSVWYRNIEIQLLPGDSLYPTSLAGKTRHGIKKEAETPRLILTDGMRPLLLSGPPGFERLRDLQGRRLTHRSLPLAPGKGSTHETGEKP